MSGSAWCPPCCGRRRRAVAGRPGRWRSPGAGTDSGSPPARRRCLPGPGKLAGPVQHYQRKFPRVVRDLVERVGVVTPVGLALRLRGAERIELPGRGRGRSADGEASLIREREGSRILGSRAGTARRQQRGGGQRRDDHPAVVLLMVTSSMSFVLGCSADQVVATKPVVEVGAGVPYLLASRTARPRSTVAVVRRCGRSRRSRTCR